MKHSDEIEKPTIFRFTNETGTKLWKNPGVAGTGYGYNVKPVILGDTTSLVRSVIHEAMKMPDIATAAAMHVSLTTGSATGHEIFQVLRRRGYDVGPSTALNILVALSKAYFHK